MPGEDIREQSLYPCTFSLGCSFCFPSIYMLVLRRCFRLCLVDPLTKVTVTLLTAYPGLVLRDADPKLRSVFPPLQKWVIMLQYPNPSHFMPERKTWDEYFSDIKKYHAERKERLSRVLPPCTLSPVF